MVVSICLYYNAVGLYYCVRCTWIHAVHEHCGREILWRTYGSRSRRCHQDSDILSNHSAETKEYTSHHHMWTHHCCTCHLELQLQVQLVHLFTARQTLHVSLAWHCYVVFVYCMWMSSCTKTNKLPSTLDYFTRSLQVGKEFFPQIVP